MYDHIRPNMKMYGYLWLCMTMFDYVWQYTGWFIMIEIKFELHTRARIQAVSWERCTFSNEILTFCNCASKNAKEFNVFFKFGGNFDAWILKI